MRYNAYCVCLSHLTAYGYFRGQTVFLSNLGPNFIQHASKILRKNGKAYLVLENDAPSAVLIGVTIAGDLVDLLIQHFIVAVQGTTSRNVSQDNRELSMPQLTGM